MSRNLQVVERAGERLAELAHLVDVADVDARNAVSDATRRAYATDLGDFEGWCARYGTPAFPIRPEAARAYLAYLANTRGYALSTIVRRRAAISVEYKRRGITAAPFGDPQVVATWKGIRRRLGAAPQNAREALLIEDLRRVVAPLGNALLDVRDRALLLVGWAGAFRRSEVTAFDVDDVRFVPQGLELLLRRSKTDQEGEGRVVGNPYGSHLETCPVRAVRAWLDASAITTGPLFRAVGRGGSVAPSALCPKEVARSLKRRAAAAGLDPARLAGHSLRAGFCTTGALCGLSETTIAAQSGHRSLAVLRRYIRRATCWQGNAAAAVGL